MQLSGEYLLGTTGGNDLADYLQAIRSEIAEYFSALEEIALGLRDPNIHLDKPEALITYEQCRSMAIPLVVGGLMDQPYLWLLVWAICQQEEQVFQAIHKANQAKPPQTSANKRDLLTNAPQI